MTYRLKTRFAPTPNGPLHIGNAFNFLITWLVARSQGGTILLRIDDIDEARARDAYVEECFRALNWLGLDWDQGPHDAIEFKSKWSQGLRKQRYCDAAKILMDQGQLFACGCTRETLKNQINPNARKDLYPGACRNAGLSWDSHAWRFKATQGDISMRNADGGAEKFHSQNGLGDFVIRNREGQFAYQLASVCDDVDFGINFVVRGWDLLPSTLSQLQLANACQMDGPQISSFPHTRFLHHGLVYKNGEDNKLSKSQGAESFSAWQENAVDSKPLLKIFSSWLGYHPDLIGHPRDMLENFHLGRVPLEKLSVENLLAQGETA